MTDETREQSFYLVEAFANAVSTMQRDAPSNALTNIQRAESEVEILQKVADLHILAAKRIEQHQVQKDQHVWDEAKGMQKQNVDILS